MDKNNIIGFVLIFVILMVWMRVTAPSPEQLAERERIQDSIRVAQITADSLAQLPANTDTNRTIQNTTQTVPVVSDSIKAIQQQSAYGAFVHAASGTESEYTLENNLMKVSFTNKGGRIKKVELKKHFQIIVDDEGNESKIPLKLLDNPKNKFEYFLPVSNLPNGGIKTSDLFFTPQLQDSVIIFRAHAGDGQYFEQKYTIHEGRYGMDYELNLVGLNGLLSNNVNTIQLNWENHLAKLEVNTQYERMYSSLYYKEADDDPTYLSSRKDSEAAIDVPVKWVANSNQFFNSALIADASFAKAKVASHMMSDKDEDLKLMSSQIDIPIENATGTFKMKFYNGPNQFTRLRSYGDGFEDVIPFGWSIFGTINRWIIRPVFNFLSSFIGSKGIVILVLTLLVKLMLFPLTYKMLYSQSKMAALKPRLAKLKDKYPNDPQKQQMEQMTLYREFGVSPFGGCMPMVLQMPIWFALYRFFPGSIEFRQASFLWATDLSSYDVFMKLPWNIPFYGAHVSLFTLLWAGTTLIYTYYNTRHMEMGTNPMMKYMQYGMPVMFLFFFNNYAAGLTLYLFYSNLMNITQTIVTKNYIIDQDKIKRELEAYKKKPKKKGGFSDRLQKALQEQQRIQAERDAKAGKKKKK